MEIITQAAWRRPDAGAPEQAREAAASMIAAIRQRGDAAVTEFSRRFDGFEPEMVALKDWRDYGLSDEVCDALATAAQRIERFAQMQRRMYRDDMVEDAYGRYGQTIVPLDSMAAYIPGGRFPLVSTALMTLIPARVAGVPERLAMSPAKDPAILAAAALGGATRFVHLGGAQAIAAAALGSQWTPPVDMIVGPGNAYVNAAKGLLQDQIKIDTLAGPSEILVLCDDSVDPQWVALDVLAQAEHDPMALSVLGSTSRELLTAVAACISKHLAANPDKDQGIIQLVHCEDAAEMVALSNQMAPEHLLVAVRDGVLRREDFTQYGGLFWGAHAAVALGDYCSGPNHTLPTMGYARRKGGLSAGDFLKVLTWQEINGETFDDLARTAVTLARTEGLVFHEASLTVRLGKR